MNDLLPRNLATQLYSSQIESTASELAARMTAMDNATRNAGEMIDNLTLQYNRTRQALAFLSDNELETMGITRTSLDTGDFYNYKEVANFPTKKISRIKSKKAKAA